MHTQLIKLTRGRLLFALLLTTLLAACGARPAVGDVSQPTTTVATAAPISTPAPTNAPAPTAASTNAPAPTSTPAPTAAPAAGMLPAPLYLFNDQAQIVRLEADGKTVAQITHEAEPIAQFSISPADGSLLYTIGQRQTQQLIYADARGSNRTVLLKGSLFSPIWAPNGQRYAVAWKDGPDGPGVYTATVNGGQPKRLVVNVPWRKGSAQPGKIYQPLAWSPNGERLLMYVVPDVDPNTASGDISVVGYAATGADGRPADLVSFGGDPYLCFDPSWSADSSYVYCANYGASGGKPALWRIAADGGKPEVLIASKPSGEQLDIFNARQIDGQLYAFVAEFKDGTFAPTYAMQRFGADGSAPAKLRDDAFGGDAVNGSLWAPDGSGAVVQKAQEGQPSNALIWAPANGDAPVTLGSRAFGQPQWGPTQP